MLKITVDGTTVLTEIKGKPTQIINDLMKANNSVVEAFVRSTNHSRKEMYNLLSILLDAAAESDISCDSVIVDMNALKRKGE